MQAGGTFPSLGEPSTCCTKSQLEFFSLSLFLSLCTALKNIPDSFSGQKKASCVCADCELSSLGQAAHGPPAIVLGVCGLHDSCTDVFICLRASRLASQPASQPARLLQVAEVDGQRDVHSVAKRGPEGLLRSLQTLLQDVPPPSAPLCGLSFLPSFSFHLSVTCLCSNQNTGPAMDECHAPVPSPASAVRPLSLLT